ncbi:MAG: cytochrome c maturation protein CcmE [Anaerolineae bacterium]|nr:cytochrome c maturation protein CcmE [Anaerolineae bacterium]
MADVAWTDDLPEEKASSAGGINPKFLIGGALIIGAVSLLVVAGVLSGGQPFITVEEVLSRPDLAGRTVQTSGVVIGETIEFQEDPMELRFTIANISGDMAHIEDQGGLAEALHRAASDPNAARVPVVILNQAMPDLLQHEAQAILTGSMGEDGVFYATDLMLKCPTRYSDAVPDQVE